MQASYSCQHLIKSSRKIILTPTKLWNKSLGIGWEHKYKTKREEDSLKSITYTKADILLQQDLLTISNSLTKLLDIDVTQNQFDALVSLIYDIGITAFKYSEILVLLNQGDLDGAISQFRVWSKYLGTPLYRLAKARKLEIELFTKQK